MREYIAISEKKKQEFFRARPDSNDAIDWAKQIGF
jgi:hypothetical protein